MKILLNDKWSFKLKNQNVGYHNSNYHYNYRYPDGYYVYSSNEALLRPPELGQAIQLAVELGLVSIKDNFTLTDFGKSLATLLQ